MAGAPQTLPEGRYGRSDDTRADRRLKVIGAVFGAALLGFVAWGAVDATAGSKASGELIRFQVMSDTEVQAHIEVRKKADVDAVCTLRSLAADKSEVGVRDVRIDEQKTRVDTVVSIRTTGRGANAELVGCKAADER
ncbi:DUF4307 domain-containing protein [Streptomyces sp. CMB-StM0423]|uniref:DUF4307 domain-containing protein n=1 Tax=Streptomyces sp. CMB-StM0423 TaxID=2059884 RepID=UPI000C6FE2A7|nr:DUF4307 domain-containing protein [Streptomyces sp. CMB-StM0423]AUH40949.1 DUF4307 domain-containing protein [Streptomyces sp. CMB-StM0423]